MVLLRFVEFIFVLQILSIWSPTVQTADFLTDCDTFYNKSCFNYIKTPYKGWSDARTDCVSRGGYLTSINSENENDMLGSLTRNAYGYTGSNAWIGLDYNRYIQSTNWVDGNPITYSRTADTSSTSPLCFVITGGGTWRAFSCSGRRSYICRRPGGSSFALKRDNGQYESIDGYNTIINSIPTTLICRTDTYQPTQITWEYKYMQNEQWTDIQGNWDETTGISELNISNNGYYRCHVKSGGSDQLYTATAIDPSLSVDTTDSTTDMTTTIKTTLPLVSTTTGKFPTKRMKNSAEYICLPKYQTILGGVIALIVFLIVTLVCMITIVLLHARKRRRLANQFQRTAQNGERTEYQCITDINPGIQLRESNPNKYNRTKIATDTDAGKYFYLSDVTNQRSAGVTQDPDDYTTMLGVEIPNINPTN